MNTAFNNLVMSNKAFVWIASATGIALMIPLLAMQLTSEVNWGFMDFVVMGVLVFGSGSLFVLVARKVKYKYWPAIAVVFAVGVIYVWAELAVGIFTNFGS